MHEGQRHSSELFADPIDIAAQHRREVGVHHRCACSRNQPKQRADLMAGRDMGKPSRAGKFGDAGFGIGEFPGMDQRDGAGFKATRLLGLERIQQRRLIEHIDHIAACRNPSRDLKNISIKRGRQLHIQREKIRPRLVADAQQIGIAPINQQQHPRALALQQGVGRDGCAKPHLGDDLRRNRCVASQTQHRANTRRGSIPVSLRVFTQQLVRANGAIGRARHNIGERPTPVDPEMPACHRVGHGRGGGQVKVR